MSEHTYHIHLYSHEDAEGVATMWNESDEQWPGTFTRGVPLTGERVIEWQDKLDLLLNLIVKRDDGVVVAYGNLRDTPNQTGVSCYVPLLNVHPEHQGRSLCRRMLQQMVDYATEKGYQRMTIGTWAGNLKSVPLYKKIGFFWTPGKDVRMENYIPLLRQQPILKSFFAEADWYRHFVRELKQVQDVQTHPYTADMSIYRCRWEMGGRFVEGVIDREGQSLTGLETEMFAVHTAVATSQPAQGLSYPIRYRLENKQPTAVSFTLAVTADAGIDVGPTQYQLTLQPGEVREIEDQFCCHIDAPTVDLKDQWENLSRPLIHTRVEVADQTVELKTGLAYRQPVTLSTRPKLISLLPEQEAEVLVQVQNEANEPFTGVVRLNTSNTFTPSWQERPFSLPPHGFASFPVTVRTHGPGSDSLRMVADLTTSSGQQVTTQPVETAVLSRPLGQVMAAQADKTTFIENDSYQLWIDEKAGRVNVWHPSLQQSLFWFREEVGPPFQPHDLEERLYEISFDKSEPNTISATFSYQSDETGRFPGLRIERTVVFNASPLVTITHRLINQGDRPIEPILLNRHMLVNSNDINGRSFMPHADGVLSDVATLFPTQTEDMPKNPAEMSEQWVAFEVEDRVMGTIWTAAGKHEIHWGMIDLHHQAAPLSPGQSVTLPPVYAYCGPGGWPDIQRLWRRLVNQSSPHPTAVLPLTQLALVPDPVLTLLDEMTVQLQLHNRLKKTFTGKVQLLPPDGWAVDPQTISIDEVVQNGRFDQALQLVNQEKRIGPARLTVTVQTPLADETEEITLFRVGDATQTVNVQEAAGEDDQPLLTVDNGRSRFVVAPHYHGGLISWTENGGPNQLFSKYPDRFAHFVEFFPFFGGIQPMLPNYDTGDWLGKLYNESFDYRLTDHTDLHGLVWQGVQVSTSPGAHTHRGLKIEVDYMTLPGSNLLKVIYRMVNETAVYRQVYPRLQSYFQTDGQFDNALMLTTDYQRKRDKSDYWEWHNSPWGISLNHDTGRAMMVIKGSGRRTVFIQDMGQYGAHFWIDDRVEIPPHNAHELIGYYVLAETLDDAREYGRLAEG